MLTRLVHFGVKVHPISNTVSTRFQKYGTAIFAKRYILKYLNYEKHSTTWNKRIFGSILINKTVSILLEMTKQMVTLWIYDNV